VVPIWVAGSRRRGDRAHCGARCPREPVLKEMQASLVKVVANVRQNSESVATASAQIAQGNQDLSQRTEVGASLARGA
jgi:hypothetical protein